MTGLPDGWSETALDELGAWGSGGTPRAGDRRFYGGDIPFVKIGDLNDGRLAQTSESLTEEGLAASAAKWVPPGSLLVAMYGSIGKLGITAMPVATNQAIAFLNPNPSLTNTEFVYWALRNFRSDLISMGQGGTQQNISQKLLRAYRVPLPPVAEQRRIVAKLDALTARTARARADLDRIPALTARYKQAVLAKAFSGELTARFRIANPQAHPESFDAGNISGQSPAVGTLGTGWTWTSVGDLCLVSGGLTKNAKRTAAGKQVPYLRVANVYTDELRLHDVAMIGCNDTELAKTQLQRGDVLVVEGNGSLGQVGRAAVWDEELEVCSHQNHLIRLRSDGRLLPRYLLLWLSSPAGRAAIEGVASSSSGLHTLSVAKVKGLPLPWCSHGEQEQIVNLVDRAFAEIDRLTAEAAAARRLLGRLDQAVLAKAFRGELAPQDPDDEPASVLLERIRAERAAAPKAKWGRKSAVPA